MRLKVCQLTSPNFHLRQGETRENPLDTLAMVASLVNNKYFRVFLVRTNIKIKV